MFSSWYSDTPSRSPRQSTLDVSGPELEEAVVDVRSDGTPTTYLIFTYQDTKTPKIVLKYTGSDSPYSAVDHMPEDEVSYALLRISGSKTVKFVFAVYVGPAVGVGLKGRVGADKFDVKGVVGAVHVDIPTDDKDDLSEEAITNKLNQASGANDDVTMYESTTSDAFRRASANYSELEKQSNIDAPVFDKHAKPKNYVSPMGVGLSPRTVNAARTSASIDKSSMAAERQATLKAAELSKKNKNSSWSGWLFGSEGTKQADEEADDWSLFALCAAPRKIPESREEQPAPVPVVKE